MSLSPNPSPDPNWKIGAKMRGGESLFSIHVRARQMLRKLYRRDTQAFPKSMEFKFVEQKVSTMSQTIAYTKGEKVIEVLGHMWDRYAILAISRNEHLLEYTYLTPQR